MARRRRHPWVASSLGALAALALVSSAARADDPSATAGKTASGTPARSARRARALALHRQAMALFRNNQHRAAIALFERAYAIAPHANTLYGIAEAYRRLGDLRRSGEYYRRYAETLPGPRRRAFLAKLRRTFAAHRGKTRAPTSKPTAPTTRATKSARATPAAPTATPTATSPTTPPPRAAPTARVSARTTSASTSTSSTPGGLFFGVTAGPSFSSYGDERLELAAGAEVAAETGYLWRLGRRFGLHGHLQLSIAPLRDAVVDDVAAFVSLTAGVGGRLYLGRRVYLEARVGLGPVFLVGAATRGFLFDSGADVASAPVGLLVRPAVAIGVQLWRGLALSLAPTLSYSPRAGGFDSFSASIARVARYHVGLGASWQL